MKICYDSKRKYMQVYFLNYAMQENYNKSQRFASKSFPTNISVFFYERSFILSNKNLFKIDIPYKNIFNLAQPV